MIQAWLYRRRGGLWGVTAAVAGLLLLAGLGALLRILAGGPWALVLLGTGLVLAGVAARMRRWVPRRTFLELDFERGVVESPPAGLGGRLLRRPLVLADVLDALERAGDDPRILGLVARVGSFRPGLAVAQELRDAIHAFRGKGKRAIAWAETLGEGASATVEIYLVAAFEHVTLHPVGEVGLDGVLVRHPFVKGALEKLGVDPQLDHRREYKTAKYLFTERGFNEAHRASTEALLEDQVEQIVEGIAADRGLEPTAVRALLDRGPFLADEAKDAGLIDAVAYRDEVYAGLEREHRARLLYLDRYLARAGRPHRRGVRVALVHGVGGIARGASRPASPFRGATMGSDDVALALRRAATSKRVRAILFRVDSPGGSAVASDAVWREVGRAREAGKPVVVSMGNVAASGGYYVAMGADRIVAQPGTLTGSIGVVWGKFVTREAFAKLGIDFDSLQIGENADLWSPSHAFSEPGWAKMQRMLDRVYEDFKARVASSRGLDADRVEEVARGRVWTGHQAKAQGLVDDLGGRERALALLRERLGLAESAPLRLVSTARRRGIFGRRREESSDAAAALEGLARAARSVGLGTPQGPLVLPPIEVSTSAR